MPKTTARSYEDIFVQMLVKAGYSKNESQHTWDETMMNDLDDTLSLVGALIGEAYDKRNTPAVQQAYAAAAHALLSHARSL